MRFNNLFDRERISNLMGKTKPSKKEDIPARIGIDVGNHTIKAVAISRIGAKNRLLGFSLKPAGENIIRAIKEAHADLKITSSKVITSVSGAGVIVRYLEMPSMTEEELDSAAKFEAEKVIPYHINDIILDSAKIEDIGKNRMRVVIVAVKKDVVDMHLNLMNQAGLEPVILDIDSFALMNAFASAGIDKESVCGLINIGAKRTNLNIVKAGVSYLCRDIDIGGNNIAKLIAQGNAEAEKDPKIVEDKLANLANLPPDDKGIIGRYLEDVLSRLADEVRLSFDFYENQHTGVINKVYISGGMSKSELVENFLKENLGRDTLKWDPVSGMDIETGLNKQALDSAKSQLAVCTGLAIRSII